jgi:hypothetical protein
VSNPTTKFKSLFRPLWEHAEKLAALLSILAILLSIYSVVQSRAAQELAERQFQSERKLVLSGVIHDQSLILQPTDDEFRLQQVYCHFPKSLDASREFISPDCKVSLLLAESRLQDLFAKRVKPEKNQIQYMPYGVVPVVVDAQYVAENEVYHDRGFYTMSYSAIQSDEPFKRPTIEIRGLLFVCRLPPDIDPQAFVETRWEESLSQFPSNGDSQRGESGKDGHR